jgi:MYXO-CTERM domain-containing protein
MSLNSKLAKHFAVAATAVVGVAASANAAVITTNYNIAIPANVDGLYVNVETGQTGAPGSAVAGWDINPWGATSLNFFSPAAPAGGAYWKQNGSIAGTSSLAVGSVVGDASGTWQSSAATVGPGLGGWTLNARNYFGFRFNTAAGQTRFGFAAIDLGASITVRTLAFISWEDTGGTITVVPTPAAAAGLLGLAAVGGRRRRR